MRQRAHLDSTRQSLCAAMLRPISTWTRGPGRQIACASRPQGGGETGLQIHKEPGCIWARMTTPLSELSSRPLKGPGCPGDNKETLFSIREIAFLHCTSFQNLNDCLLTVMTTQGTTQFFTTPRIKIIFQHQMSGHVVVTSHLDETKVQRPEQHTAAENATQSALQLKESSDTDSSVTKPTLAVHLPMAIRLFHLALMLRIQLPGAPGNSCPHPHVGLAQHVQQLASHDLYMQVPQTQRIVDHQHGGSEERVTRVLVERDVATKRKIFLNVSSNLTLNVQQTSTNCKNKREMHSSQRHRVHTA